MTQQNRRLLAAGLLAGVIAIPAFGSGFVPDEPGRGESVPPSRPAEGGIRYLLLTNGKLVPGIITHDDTDYTVTQKIGAIRFPKKLVERSFDSVRQAYEYLLQRLPEDDTSERIALARWCLNQHMTAEARAHLDKVLEISPQHMQAKAMLTKLAQSEASRMARAESKVDPAVLLSSGEEVVEDRAGALDSSVFRGAARELGITGAPVIFDLPPQVAQRRAEQFRQFVHPVLQAYCAKCHNANYDGQFQLLPASTARRPTPDVLRANLDATLRLVDPENPARSELLSSTLRPHGHGGPKRPIFPGSNNRAYQILASWVNSLAAGDRAEVARRGGEPDGDSPAEDFAIGRRSGAAPRDRVARGSATADPRRSAAGAIADGADATGPAYRYVEGQGVVEEEGPADPKEFPLPYMMGGPRPTGPSRGPRAAGTGARGGRANPRRALAGEVDPEAIRAGMTGGRAANPGADGRPTATQGLAGEIDAEAIRAGKAAAKAEAEKEAQARRQAAKDPKSSGAAKKKVKVDPAILERLLQSNGYRAPGQ